jgi:HEAT repeat protein
LSEHTRRLRRLAGGQSAEARAAALLALARTRELEHVPLLIDALKDPDPMVFLAAQDGLRFLRRKFRGSELSEESTEAQRASAREEWNAWLLAIRPVEGFDE